MPEHLCQEYVIDNKHTLGICLRMMPCSGEDKHSTEDEIEEWYRAMKKVEKEYRSLASMDRGDKHLQ